MTSQKLNCQTLLDMINAKITHQFFYLGELNNKLFLHKYGENLNPQTKLMAENKMLIYLRGAYFIAELQAKTEAQ